MATLRAHIGQIMSIGITVGLLTASTAASGAAALYNVSSADKVERFLTENISDKFSGALLIAQDGEIIHGQGYGLANREDNIPNGLDTVFEIGGLTQYFTATAVLKLVEQGKLNLDDTLPNFFDNVPENKQNITVHHLLTHTPGLFEDDKLDVLEVASEEAFLKDVFSQEDSISPAVYLPTFAFQPGERSITFNLGYNLLALIVEKRSGQSFEAFLNEYLFEPANIKNTGYMLPDWKPEQLANAYAGDEGKSQGNLVELLSKNASLPPYLKGSLGLSSTVSDLYQWHLALRDGKILSSDLVQLLDMRHIGLTERFEADIDQGYGISITETWSGTPWLLNVGLFNASNGLPVFEVGYNYFPDDNTVVIFASNTPLDADFYDSFYPLIRLLLEQDYTPHSQPVLSRNEEEQR
ncbi:serine hydrolase domain-containing protein [Kordiimonas aquimaris]|uniref:serine hydrolase domain-containing protein n=1 Tax=Kordiimonas aquimaris TaxID=707591 RepID=UPI0021CDEE6C|nr:serine hydrolase [Kordiimonas aquimaris]